MGIKQLMSLIQEKSPKSIKMIQPDMLSGKTLAIDASMAMYQFLIATQQFMQYGYQRPGSINEFKDEEGNLTAHLVGLFNRTIHFYENGIKPIWVFDGKPPEMKQNLLDKRKEDKQKAEQERKEAEQAGYWDKAKQMAGRSIYVTAAMKADAMKLIKLMGAAVVEAPCEAEAQCAELVRQGLAFGTVTEDMDALTFGTNYLVRGFNSKKEPICQIQLSQVLEDFEMTQDQFIDLCILCGCDYADTIVGIGPVTAFKILKERSDIEGALKKLEYSNQDSSKKKKFIIPPNFLESVEKSRDLFKNPEVIKDKEQLEKMIMFDKPQEDELKEWLFEQKGFNETKVQSGIDKLKKSQKSKNQSRLDNFFKSTMISSKKVQAPPGKKDQKNAKGKGAAGKAKVKGGAFC